MNRRELLQGISASVLSATVLPGSQLHADGQSAAPARPFAANDRIGVGVIGPGSRGQELIRQFLRVPGVEITAVCDVYEPRFAEVEELTGRKIPACRDYRELLERKDVDCVVIATPPVFHAPYAIAALKSGRPVYGEKTLGFTAQDCHDVLDAVAQTRQIYQVGHQMRYASWIQESINRALAGDIGEPTQIYAYWHRRDDWRREVPHPQLEHLLNWRLYRESSGGLLEELGSHHIDIANWVFGDQPETAMGSSSIAVYHDGRTVGDNVQAVFGYTRGRKLFFSSITDNAMMADQLWIYGTEGSIQITLEDATFYSPTRKTITAASHSQMVEKGVETGPSFQANWEMPYRGPGERIHFKPKEDATLTACRTFIDCVREKREPVADARVGFCSAIACTMGRQAIDEGRTINIPQLRSL